MGSDINVAILTRLMSELVADPILVGFEIR